MAKRASLYISVKKAHLLLNEAVVANHMIMEVIPKKQRPTEVKLLLLHEPRSLVADHAAKIIVS